MTASCLPASCPLARKRVVLMRHGEVRYFEADGRPVDPRTVALTEDGRRQAAAAAAMLADYRFRPRPLFLGTADAGDGGLHPGADCRRNRHAP